ncbi:MAG: hypothetical protein KC502_11425 [Myxococcales bacterium]|nr:hypothetical protein [Myxococcales bacterium]
MTLISQQIDAFPPSGRNCPSRRALWVAGGLPVASEGHVVALARFSLDMVDVLDELRDQSGAKLQMRTGIHTRPVVAGVIGKRKFAYDLWGDTVDTVARMESHGEPGRVHVSETVAKLPGDELWLEERGMINVKGKGRYAPSSWSEHLERRADSPTQDAPACRVSATGPGQNGAGRHTAVREGVPLSRSDRASEPLDEWNCVDELVDEEAWSQELVV